MPGGSVLREIPGRGVERIRCAPYLRLADEAEADELAVGEPPAALGELRVRLLPGRRLPPAGFGRDLGRRVPERPPAQHRLPLHVRRPLAGVAGSSRLPVAMERPPGEAALWVICGCLPSDDAGDGRGGRLSEPVRVRGDD